ncbi:MAG: hypothetical protein LC808_28030 [Actinobacteria bacterium]|nr:hypothetical protein [Actinomycetota bacterium]
MVKARTSLQVLVPLLVATAALGACTGNSTEPTPVAADTPESSGSSVTSAALPQGDDPVELDPANFTAEISNPYLPFVTGKRWTYREIDEKGTRLKVVVVVTTETKKMANGITARVVRDTVSEGGSIVEDTFDWYAQDDEGNVWYMGEKTAEFENGKITSRHGSFEAGVDGALPGIIMPAHPEPGLAYRQEYLKGEAEDNGEILSVEEMADAPLGHFDNLVLEKNTITIEPKVLEYKFYAKGIGQVLALGVSGGGGREELLKIDRAPKSAGTGPLGHPNP